MFIAFPSKVAWLELSASCRGAGEPPASRRARALPRSSMPRADLYSAREWCGGGDSAGDNAGGGGWVGGVSGGTRGGG